MSSVTVKDLDNLTTEIFDLKAQHDELEERLKALGNDLKAREQKCVDYLKELGLSTFKGSRGTLTPYLKQAYTTPKTPEDRAAFFEHLRKEGLFDSMVTVNYQTLNAYAKEFVEAAREKGDMFAAIPGLSAPTVTTILSKTKGKI